MPKTEGETFSYSMNKNNFMSWMRQKWFWWDIAKVRQKIIPDSNKMVEKEKQKKATRDLKLSECCRVKEIIGQVSKVRYKLHPDWITLVYRSCRKWRLVFFYTELSPWKMERLKKLWLLEYLLWFFFKEFATGKYFFEYVNE